MRALEYVYDSETAEPHVAAVRERLAEREEDVELLDVAAGDRDVAVRDAMLAVRSAVRVGSNPEGIYDDEGNVDFSAGALITEEPTGRRSLHVGEDALAALERDDAGGGT